MGWGNQYHVKFYVDMCVSLCVHAYVSVGPTEFKEDCWELELKAVVSHQWTLWTKYWSRAEQQVLFIAELPCQTPVLCFSLNRKMWAMKIVLADLLHVSQCPLWPWPIMAVCLRCRQFDVKGMCDITSCFSGALTGPDLNLTYVVSCYLMRNASH